jgi:excinuclease ABC subunit A
VWRIHEGILMASQRIEVEGARTHNLRSVTCSFPHRSITVVTGVSGSGKSSLAFDTVYAEGQRRYVETLSTYARQFLQQMRKPPVDSIRQLPPSLALRQGHSVGGARSTVGTITEVNEHLHLLFAAAGSVSCVGCGAPVKTNTPAGVADRLAAEAAGERILVCAEVRPSGDEGMAMLLRQLAAEGHRRLLVGDDVVDIDSVDITRVLDEHRVLVVLDRLSVEPQSQRIVEAVETAFSMGEQAARVVLWDRRGAGTDSHRVYYAGFRCDACGVENQRPIPALFNSQSTLGECKTCSGFGRTVGIDEARVVPDPRKSLEDGAIACFQVPSAKSAQTKLIRGCIDRGVPIDVPWIALSQEQRNWVWRGSGTYRGVEGFFDELEADRYKPHVRIFMARFRGYTRCSVCEGSGLSASARAVAVAGFGLPAILQMRLDEVNLWLQNLALGERMTRAIDSLLRELRHRVEFLVESGVGYLTLTRPARTLSGGELHRVLLATSVGRQLTDTCYVLDEPTAGLHPRDTDRLFGVVRRLRDAGNTVIVVEHDPDVIADADWIVEIGPEAGAHGGNVVFEGDVAELRRRTDTVTGAMLHRRTLARTVRPMPEDGELRIVGACLNNLRDVSARFPKRRLSVVTGVSGSGKSSLVSDVLVGRLLEARGTRSEIELGPAEVLGDDFAEIVLVDQNSVARSSRSCALTFSGAYTAIRELYAASDAAIERGVTASAFSFNTSGGRCERCEGTGVLNIEMHFLADVELTCDVCDGRRFGPAVLACQWNGRSIADVFEMTVDEALEFFVDRYAIIRRLEPLSRVGLGYIRLGQPTTQLSGGELQRLKLSSFLAEAATGTSGGKRLFVFDEPTVGLHMRDVERLIAVLHALRDAGNTVIVVEHNLDLVAAADHVVDLGPGAGPEGGEVVYQGDVAGLLGAARSLTGRYLAASFAGAAE